jgi:hypothetical protein
MVEIAKPFTMVFCVVALYRLFYIAFLDPAIEFEDRIYWSLTLLALTAGICLVSGMVFREAEGGRRHPRLITTLPVQMFCWASGLMTILFFLSWFLRSQCVFYRDIHVYASSSRL